MRWPSDVLGDLAGKLETWEDAAYEQYVLAEGWVRGFKVWQWRDQQEVINDLRDKNRMLVEEYKKLAEAYRAETGKQPPTTFVPIFADVEGIERAMDLFRDALRKLGEQTRARLNALHREGSW